MGNKSSNLHNKAMIFIEPSDAKGFTPVISIRKSKEELAKQAEIAIENTMKTIYDMVIKVNNTIEKITPDQKPKNVEVQFGIKFNGELDLIIAKAGAEASFQVTLAWENRLET